MFTPTCGGKALIWLAYETIALILTFPTKRQRKA